MTGSGATGSPGDPVNVAEILAVGRQAFLGIDLLCGPGTLVPRPETEILARAAIEKISTGTDRVRIIDMCCGAGNLACAIATWVPKASVWASDLTDSCVQWTRQNVERLGLGDRVVVARGNLFDGLDGLGLGGTIDAIVCNPPYVSTGRLAGDRAALLEHEPREAFDGGPYGLTIHQRVISQAPRFLKPGGWLLMEFGLGQCRQVQILLQRVHRFGTIEVVHDADGTPRVIAAGLHG